MRPWALGVVIGALLAAAVNSPTSAHVTVVSTYTFNQHVLPILQQRCGACHGENTPGRALLQFDQAKSHSVEIARSLMVGRMPPWPAEAGTVAIKGQQSVTPRELDILMTWAAGGTPKGNTSSSPNFAPSIGPDATPLGTPDLTLRMPNVVVLESSETLGVHEEVFAAGAARGRAIRAVDVMPGNPSIVRRAEVAIRTATGDRTIALWVPGDMPQTLEGDAAYPVPRNASFVLRVYYMRQWAVTREPRSDSSRIGLFFSKTRRSPQPHDLLIEGTGIFRVDQPRVVSQRIARTVRAIALRPISGPVDAIVSLDIVGASGVREPLARLQLRADWPRRYVLTSPVMLGAGDRIDARVIRRDPVLWSALTGDGGIPAREQPLRIAIETID